MDEFFTKLDDRDYFCEMVRSFYEGASAELAPIFECKIEIDPAKLDYAHGEYTQAVKKLVLHVDSKNPDHFKRAGALLHALRDGIIAQITYGTDWEEVEAGGGPLDLHYNDVSSGMEFKRFFDRFHDEMLAFMFAFKCCDAYQLGDNSYSFDYLQNICAYLQRNPSDDGLETCFMIFKSLME